MAWIDNGSGSWVWDGAPGARPPAPGTPPPSGAAGDGTDSFGQTPGVSATAPKAQQVDLSRAPVVTAPQPQATHSGYAGRALTTGSREGQATPVAGLRPGGNVGGATGAYNSRAYTEPREVSAMRIAASAPTPVAAQPTTAAPDPGAAVPRPGYQPFTPQAADYSRYDAAAEYLKSSRDTFQSELTRLSGVDPFGNQAFLQKATDRAVAQAAGTGAMARGGAASQAGAQRQQQGVQSQLAARGAQEMEQTVARDANTAAGLRLQAASGMAGVSGQLAENEAAFANKAADVGVANLNAAVERYGTDAQIGQRERESLRSLAVEMQKVDMQRYQTDMQYRMNVDDNIIAKYVSDNSLKGVLEQVKAQEGLSAGEFLMGVMGAGAGVLGQVATSDRRAKHRIHSAKLAELKEFLGTSRGSHYEYREPGKAGRRPGANFGPMAQDLRKSRIGRTVVVEQADGTLGVDTSRLALADHGALAALAQRVERLAARISSKKAPK